MDCWKVLEIAPTSDRDEIKKAYRLLAQKYHPDKARTPEKQRKYTVRFVEIHSAYDEALRQAEQGLVICPSIGGGNRGSVASWRVWARVASVFVGGGAGIFLIVFLAKQAMGFPESHPFPVALAAILSAGMGYFAGFFLFLLLLMLYAPVIVLLDKVGLQRYTDKLGWALSVLLWLLVVFRMDRPALRATEVGNAVLWFVAFGFGPVLGFATWMVDYFRFRRVRGRYLAVIANNAMQATREDARA